jgi:hypothetical protein
LQAPRTYAGLGAWSQVRCAGATNAHVGDEGVGRGQTGTMALCGERPKKYSVLAKHWLQLKQVVAAGHLCWRVSLASLAMCRCARRCETRAQPNKPGLRHREMPTTRRDSLLRRRGECTPQNHLHACTRTLDRRVHGPGRRTATGQRKHRQAAINHLELSKAIIQGAAVRNSRPNLYCPIFAARVPASRRQQRIKTHLG